MLEQLRSAILSGEVTTLPTLEELGDRSAGWRHGSPCRLCGGHQRHRRSFSNNQSGFVAACLSGGGRRIRHRTGLFTLELTWRRAIGKAGHDKCGKVLCRLMVPRAPWWSITMPTAVMRGILSTFGQGGEVNPPSRGAAGGRSAAPSGLPDFMKLCGCISGGRHQPISRTSLTMKRAIRGADPCADEGAYQQLRIVGLPSPCPERHRGPWAAAPVCRWWRYLGSGSLVDWEHYGIQDRSLRCKTASGPGWLW